MRRELRFINNLCQTSGASRQTWCTRIDFLPSNFVRATNERLLSSYRELCRKFTDATWCKQTTTFFMSQYKLKKAYLLLHKIGRLLRNRFAYIPVMVVVFFLLLLKCAVFWIIDTHNIMNFQQNFFLVDYNFHKEIQDYSWQTESFF